MWNQILAAALSAATATLSAVTAAIEAVTADQHNCITAQNTADVPPLYGKSGEHLILCGNQAPILYLWATWLFIELCGFG